MPRFHCVAESNRNRSVKPPHSKLDKPKLKGRSKIGAAFLIFDYSLKHESQRVGTDFSDFRAVRRWKRHGLAHRPRLFALF
jgi:hypothetical protein